MTLKDKIKTTDVDDNVTTVETLRTRDWSRDNLDKRFREVRSAHDDIENRLQKKVEKFGSIPDPDDFLGSFESWLDERGTDTELNMVGRKDAVPGAAVLAWDESLSLLIDYLVLQSELKELEHFALKKFKTEFDELLEEYRLAKSYDTIQDALGDQAEKFAVESAEQYFRKMESMVASFEKFEQARLEERKADREAFRRVAQQATGVDESQVEELAEQAKNSIGRFLDEQGVLTLDPDELESIRDRREKDEASESAAENFAGENEEENEDEDQDVVVEDSPSDRSDARKEMIEKWDDEFEMMTQQDIADALGKSQSWVSQVKSEEGLT